MKDTSDTYPSDRPRIVFDCRMTDDPASMSLTIPAHARLRDDFR